MINNEKELNYPQRVEVGVLDERHPFVCENEEMWELIDLLMVGGKKLKDNLSKFLCRKPDEEQETYDYRKKIFSYDPILPQAVNQLLNRMVVSSFTVEGLPKTNKVENEFWTYFRENLNGDGQKEKEFIKELFLALLKYKKIFILIDKPYFEGSLTSFEQEKELGLTPYFVIYSGREVIHWGEEDGKLKWVKIKKIDTSYSPYEGGSTKAQYIYIDSTHAVNYEVKGELNKDGKFSPSELTGRLTGVSEHFFPTIPIIKIELTESLYVLNEAIYLAMEHLRVHNNVSYISSIAGTIQRLFTPIVESSNDLLDMETAKLQVGSDRVLIGQSFSFNETTGKAIDTISVRLNKIENRIKDVIFSNGMGGDRPIQESGVAKGLDFVSQEQALQSYGEILVNSIEKLYRNIGLIRGYSRDMVKSISVNGFNEFVLDSVRAKLERLQLIESLKSPIALTTKKLIMVDLQKSLTPNASTMEQEAIRDETEVLYSPTEEEQSYTMEEISDLARDQIISYSTALEILGFNPEDEENKIAQQMITMAKLEKITTEITSPPEEAPEADGETMTPGEFEEEKRLAEVARVKALIKFAAEASNKEEKEIEDNFPIEGGESSEELAVMAANLIILVSDLTDTPVREIRRLVFRGEI